MTTLQTQSSVEPFLWSEAQWTYDTAKVVILPIPYEATTTYRKGCQHGPDAILTASQQLECYDEELDWEVAQEIGIYTAEHIADTRQGNVSAETMLQTVQDAIVRLHQDGKFVISLGGEHSITAGVVAGYRQQYPNEPFTVVQIDAHGDLRYEYEDSIHNHACVMRRIVEMGLPTVQIGIRSICKEESELIKDRNLTVFRAREMAAQPDWIDRAVLSIPTQKVFLTIDLDGLDPTLIPGVGTPEPGGLNWYSLIAFLRQVIETREVIGCDVMELAPVTDSVVSEFTAAKLIYKLIGYQAIARGWK